MRIELEPAAEAFLDRLDASGDPPIEALTPAEARAAESRMQAVDAADGPPVTMSDIAVAVDGRGEVSVRIVRPVASTNTRDGEEGVHGLLPVVVYFHGGGWVVGGPDTHDRLLRELAAASGAAIAFVDYSRSPEARFPVAIEQGYAVASWLGAFGSTVGIDGRHVAVAGESSGGNIATVVAMLAKQRGGPQVRHQVLICPATDSSFEQPSFREFARGYFLTPEAMDWFWDQYVPDQTTREHPFASPLRASIGDLSGLPPALVLTAEADVLRDQGEAYAKKLMLAGVPVTGVRYLGTIHNFVVLNALSRTRGARAGLQQIGQALREVFHEIRDGSHATRVA